jgi:hypothetical protein
MREELEVQMVRLLPLASTLVIFLTAAFVALGIPDSLLAIEYCRCAKIGPRVCIPDSICQQSITRGIQLDVSASPPLNILETGFSVFKNVGDEEPGYGLYSYAIVITDNDRSASFLSYVIGTIPELHKTASQRSKTNIFYIPLKNDKAEEFSKGVMFQEDQLTIPSVNYANNYYDYKIARTMLDNICDLPAKEIKRMCKGDLSRGPYIFTYSKPASKIDPVPPPFLVVDLSNVHKKAFPEFIAAFRAQVKREDISDRAKIRTLRLKLLNIVLTAADFVAPVQNGMADIVHSASGRAEEDKK